MNRGVFIATYGNACGTFGLGDGLDALANVRGGKQTDLEETHATDT